MLLILKRSRRPMACCHMQILLNPKLTSSWTRGESETLGNGTHQTQMLRLSLLLLSARCYLHPVLDPSVNSPNMASASTVWSTYELLEQILLHLPLRALLLAQRGNKASLDVIGRSQSIQRALWLEASTTDTSEWQESAKRGYVISGQAESFYDRMWLASITGNEISPIVNPFAELYVTSASAKWRRIAKKQ